MTRLLTRAALRPSAHVDTFTRDHLPPAELWPTIELTLPELREVGDTYNAGSALLAGTIGRLGGDRVALRTPEGERWTYAELDRTSDQVAQVLVDDLGVVPGNRVLLRAPNTPWTVACWLGVLKAGAVAVTTFAALRARELGPVVGRTGPAVALVDHRFTADVADLATDALPGPFRVVTVGADDPADLTVLAAAKPGDFTPVATSADDVALLCPTSGSTGVPKITMHTHRDLLAIEATFGRHVLRLEPDDVVACTAPFAFTFGLGMLVVFPLHAGASALLVEAAAPPVVADLVAEHGVTVLATAPTSYKQMIKAGRVGRLAGLRTAVSAGEHIPAHTWRRLRDEIGLEVVDGIGSTELLHIFISAAGPDIRPGATGRPVPGWRATVLDPLGQEVGPGVQGRLAVIGPVGCRYLDDERQRAYVSGGWNLTGDTFVRDEDGYFTYCARADDMIVSSGYNIGAPEVEAAIDTHPGVAEAAVVAKPDPERGSIVCAFVVPREGADVGEALAEDIQAHVKRTIAPYKYPREVRFVDTLPRNTNGKLQHYRLRRQVEAEAGSPEGATP
ncbi:AMP-binding protein [Nocardioides sp. CFH 31398]|uniref:AMP-binding protein n=1 Tax=Nocardioides sp. CFH 31398 TaxID=2919579 RepID=UPI001F05381A|nr:AMP-binding protein [Nocardioides sp. CFH 31398]MCH1866540.1 AMP-binding protein [Nocardioides sp. CFH 31398]